MNILGQKEQEEGKQRWYLAVVKTLNMRNEEQEVIAKYAAPGMQAV